MASRNGLARDHPAGIERDTGVHPGRFAGQTFTLASALGARALAKLGVLSTRLSAIDEAASMEILCSDKTVPFTRNQLSVNSTKPMDGMR